MNWEEITKNPQELKKYGLIFLAIICLIFILIFNHQSEDPLSETNLEFSETSTTKNTEPQSKFVEISGQVKKPGVYEIKKDIITLQLIQFAGGLTSQADMQFIHQKLGLATIVKESQKIYIPSIYDELVGSTSTSNNSAVISINNASKEQLMSLPGIGEVTAQKIIDNRPYQKIDDLLNVSGIGDATYNNIISLIGL